MNPNLAKLVQSDKKQLDLITDIFKKQAQLEGIKNVSGSLQGISNRIGRVIKKQQKLKALNEAIGEIDPKKVPEFKKLEDLRKQVRGAKKKLRQLKQQIKKTESVKAQIKNTEVTLKKTQADLAQAKKQSA